MGFFDRIVGRKGVADPTNNQKSHPRPGEVVLVFQDTQDPEKQFALGCAYQSGTDVPRSDELAAKWFRRAAEQGHHQAQFHLAGLYHGGQGVDLDKREAFRWYLEAAKGGHPSAPGGGGRVDETAGPLMRSLSRSLPADDPSQFGGQVAETGIRTRMRDGLVLALLVTSAGCDGFVSARVRVVSIEGTPIPNALLRLERHTEHDLARFTDADGCAYFSGVVAPVHHVRVIVGKLGFESQRLKIRTSEENCLVVRLARDGQEEGPVDILDPAACPCTSEAGYSPTMSARFKVTAADGTPVESVGVRQSNDGRNPLISVTDASGCLGVSWIVPAGLTTIPLVLEKAGYQSAAVEVPTMEDRCYTVILSQRGTGQTSTVVAVADGDCQCEMFTGDTVWTEK